MQNFQLDPRLENEGDKILDLKLSRVLLVDNALFPWIILVPRIDNIKEIIDLDKHNRSILMEEIGVISEAMIEVFSPYKLNVASLGNIVPQLHVHVVARYIEDSAWPAPVFGKDKEAYAKEKYIAIKERLKKEIMSRI